MIILVSVNCQIPNYRFAIVVIPRNTSGVWEASHHNKAEPQPFQRTWDGWTLSPVQAVLTQYSAIRMAIADLS